ncbi:MAG TPA: hypothetical protein VEK57_02855 [Thermoanaerobaculia bacterium]|nr:hypothetical protein [Thermoanaerobaculia bacterium]
MIGRDVLDGLERVVIDRAEAPGAGRRAVAPPESVSGRLRRADDHRVSDRTGQQGRIVIRTGSEILDQPRAGRRAVSPPELRPMDAVIGMEQDLPPEADEILRMRADRRSRHLGIGDRHHARSRTRQHRGQQTDEQNGQTKGFHRNWDGSDQADKNPSPSAVIRR